MRFYAVESVFLCRDSFVLAARDLELLLEMSRELAIADRVEALREIAVRYVREVTGLSAEIVVCRSGSERTPIESGVYAIPVMGTMGKVAELVLPREPKQRQVVEMMAAQTGLAIERSTERTRNTLLAGISHDLRTPLLSINGSIGVLLDEDTTLDAEQKRALLITVRDEAQKLTRLVTGLLDLVGLESGQVRAIKEWCPLEEILSSATGRLSAALAGREVKTRLGDRDELLMVAADPILLEQVFMNLVDNAAKYTPAGTAIEIVAEREGAMMRIDFIDQGRGIAPGDEKRVFEKFYRSEKSARACAGAGLGLSLCDAIVRAHGGKIEAKRGEKIGSIFSVYLPSDGPPPAMNELAE
jgi:two-component system sensor histidine kinase KdpD